MRYLLTLAAAASLAACHNRSEDEVGAAPDRGDTTAVTATDTTAVPTDSTMGQRPGATDTSFVQQDSTAASTSALRSTSLWVSSFLSFSFALPPFGFASILKSFGDSLRSSTLPTSA